MGKTILGLDLGTNSIGWALVKEAGSITEVSEIIKLGVRVIQYDNFSVVDKKNGKISDPRDFKQDFFAGKSLSPNAQRTKTRGARRNLQRFKLRRNNLIKVLIENGVITDETPLTEVGKGTTHQTLMLRARAAREKVNLEDFAKIILAINKKRGYKSSRKVKNEDGGLAIDGMYVARILYDNNLTPGQYVFRLLSEGKKYIPDFYRSDLRDEMIMIWNKQAEFYPSLLTNELFHAIEDRNKGATWKILEQPWNLQGIKQVGKKDEQRLERYKWRQQAIDKQINLEYLAIVLQEINGELNKSSGHLGAISDRSKKLYFNQITVGEYLYEQIKKNPHASLKNQIFYRQDYLDEFEQIWESQARFYPEILTPSLKEEIRDIVIFYQRKLKSQKGLISFCQFESKNEEYTDPATGKTKTRIIGQRVAPKSSPLFQEFKIWQNINNLTFVDQLTGEIIIVRELDDEIREDIFEELNLRGNLSPANVLKVISRHLYIDKPSHWKCNFEEIEGNRTNKALYDIYQKIAEAEGEGFNWAKKSAAEIKEELESLFTLLGINREILHFNANAISEKYDKQPSYQLWHLLYSAEDGGVTSEEDRILYGNNDAALCKKLHLKYGFKPEYAVMISNVALQQDYGNLSSRAMRRIIPYLQAGHPYAKNSDNEGEVGACQLAGYNHSNSDTAEELSNKVLKDKLKILTKNSLRNPVVEKILNQMVNLVNQVIEEYGKPDEVRIELARELKNSAAEREKMSSNIAERTKLNEDIKKLITKEFQIPNPTKNDIIRYRLWDELKARGYKTIFTNLYIPKEKLFSKEIDIEHIIPQALLFDNSYSNKTLAYKSENIQKRNRTAFDFISQDYNKNIKEFEENVELWCGNGKGAISKAKRNKLLITLKNIPDGFIERDLRNTQYIAKKARQMLQEVFRIVVPTTGSITDRVRQDWGLINVMKELNLLKYRALGLTKYEERYDIGSEKIKRVEVISDWTKRNDHRHHAVDALAVAFTTHNHIQYINNLNARRDTGHEKHSIIRAIENQITERRNGSRVFKEPIPNFRDVAKKHVESILISFKSKNKVVTNNINKTKVAGKDRFRKTLQITPRGQLHKETVYGKSLRPLEKPVKISSKFNIEKARLIIDKNERDAVLAHLYQFENNNEVAFAAKTLKSNPIHVNGVPLQEVRCYEEIYTIRKSVAPDLKLDKVIDTGVKNALEARLKEFNGNHKAAFSNIEENPIWLNKQKRIPIKRVTITGVNTATPLHHKKDHFGKDIINELGEKINTDFVQTRNNHHVAIYRDANGNLQEDCVSFYKAVERANQSLPIIDKILNKDIGWEFLFTMKQNEMFVFPADDFYPAEVDLLNPENAGIISRSLYRVQKIGSKDYTFRHHLETTVTNDLDFTFKRIRSVDGLKDIIKVRINHIGKIVSIGEY